MDSSVSPVRRVAAKVGILRTLARYRSRSTPDAVFVWIPKAAGTSISTALASATGSCLTLLSPGQVTACFPQRGLVTFGHQSYGQLVDEGYIDHEFDRRSFKFCFVRRWTPSAGQLIDVAKWNLLRYIPVKMRGAEDDKEETAKPFASL